MNGYQRYERKSVRHLGGDRWRLVVDDAVVIARIPKVAGRCYELVSMVPVDGDRPLRRLWVDDRGATFEIDWDDADEATVSVAGVTATLEKIEEPVTFPRHGNPPELGTPPTPGWSCTGTGTSRPRTTPSTERMAEGRGRARRPRTAGSGPCPRSSLRT